jgi:ribosomal protein S18 acetylase RimI-like enzyme
MLKNMGLQVVPESESVKRDLDASSTVTVTVKALTKELLTANNSLGAADITRAYNDGAGAKFCCLCCPLSEHESGQGVIKYMETNPSRLPSWGVAVDNDGRALGYVAMTFHPMQPMDGLHTTKPGEAYIDQLMVSAAARGNGVGTKLLEWAEALARERNSTTLSLEVLNGNPARGLYERFGLEVQPADPCSRYFISPIFICCFASLPYGCSHWGSVLMTKNLRSIDQINQ